MISFSPHLPPGRPFFQQSLGSGVSYRIGFLVSVYRIRLIASGQPLFSFLSLFSFSFSSLSSLPRPFLLHVEEAAPIYHGANSGTAGEPLSPKEDMTIRKEMVSTLRSAIANRGLAALL